jgi:hypothetical protein
MVTLRGQEEGVCHISTSDGWIWVIVGLLGGPNGGLIYAKEQRDDLS